MISAERNVSSLSNFATVGTFKFEVTAAKAREEAVKAAEAKQKMEAQAKAQAEAAAKVQLRQQESIVIIDLLSQPNRSRGVAIGRCDWL